MADAIAEAPLGARDGRLRMLRRRGAVGVTYKLSRVYWRLKSQYYFGPQFASFGARSRIRKPILIRNPAGITLGKDVFIRDGARLEVVDRPGLPAGRLEIGDGVSIEQGVHIVACDSIVIGDHVGMSARCTIIDTHHPDGAGDNRVWAVSDARSSVRIGSRVFLGAGVVVLPNVTIGDNSIIGANAVVSRDIPANVVAVGAPARPIRKLS